MLFRLLLTVDSPNNNSNRPEPSILNRVFLNHKLPAKTSDKTGSSVYATSVLYGNVFAKKRHQIHNSRIKNRCTIQINNLEAFNFL